jgi:hypothetical protein
MNYKLIFLILVLIIILYKYVYQKGFIVYTIHWYLSKYEKLINDLRKAPNLIEFQEISEKILKIKKTIQNKYSKKQLSDAVLIRSNMAQKLETSFYDNKIRLMKY